MWVANFAWPARKVAEVRSMELIREEIEEDRLGELSQHWPDSNTHPCYVLCSLGLFLEGSENHKINSQTCCQ